MTLQVPSSHSCRQTRHQRFSIEFARRFDIGGTASYIIVVEFDFGRIFNEIGNRRYRGNDEKGFSEANREYGIYDICFFYRLWFLYRGSA
jgi:hypothetical protein